jgi:hypothetical protein
MVNAKISQAFAPSALGLPTKPGIRTLVLETAKGCHKVFDLAGR